MTNKIPPPPPILLAHSALANNLSYSSLSVSFCFPNKNTILLIYCKYKKYTHIYTTYKSQYSLYIAFHSAIACLIEAALVIPGFSFWICVDTILI